MAEVYGFPRDDVTYGEKEVLKNLKYNLPRDFSVYVECPLQHRRMQRFPDFIIVTNYGVVVLEVKDWVQILEATKFGIHIRNRQGEERNEKNPVITARDYALALQELLRNIPDLINERKQLEVPWGYGVVFVHQGTAAISKLRYALGEEYVLGLQDLGPNIILSRLKKMIPEGFNATLTQGQLRHIRAAINPTVLIEPDDRPAIILDKEQEKLVLEPVVEITEETEAVQEPAQLELEVEQAAPIKIETEEMLPEEKQLAERLSVRLVRGVAGSGKSLVLIQRAKLLAATYPEWKILVMTYNTALTRRLQTELKDFSNITTVNFHKLCRDLILEYRDWNLDDCLGSWLREHRRDFDIVATLGENFIEDEFKWIKENGIADINSYLDAVRRGRGKIVRVTRLQRSLIYSLLETYRKNQDEKETFDWGDVPRIVLEGIESGVLKPDKYDAIMIDEAQDFAPMWIKVISKLYNFYSTSVFIADDPTQSIYRFYSWKEKGIPVVGRTRWLRVPYRNTRQIYRAAFSVIKDNQVLQDLFRQEGELLDPDIENDYMRNGEKPIVRKYATFDEECLQTADAVKGLLQNGVPPQQIAVLNPHKNSLERIRQGLGEAAVNVNTFQQFKGLEFKVVFLTQINELFRENMDEDGLSRSLRLVYMGMTRARESLYIGYEHHLPIALRTLVEFCDFIV